MKSMRPIALLAAVIAASLWMLGFTASTPKEEELARLRNLGKALYENPATSAEAAEIFKKALALALDSPRERVNYGLALLRAGKTEEGVEELQKAQRQDPLIPHTWFNL